MDATEQLAALDRQRVDESEDRDATIHADEAEE